MLGDVTESGERLCTELTSLWTGDLLLVASSSMN